MTGSKDFTNVFTNNDICHKEKQELEGNLSLLQREMDMKNDATNRAMIPPLLEKIKQLCDAEQMKTALATAKDFSKSRQPALMTNPGFAALTLVLKSALAPALQAEKKQKDAAARAKRTKENNEEVDAAEKAREALRGDAALTVPVLTMEEKRELLLTCSPDDPSDEFVETWSKMWNASVLARDAAFRKELQDQYEL
jgi:hypothetical protein